PRQKGSDLPDPEGRFPERAPVVRPEADPLEPRRFELTAQCVRGEQVDVVGVVAGLWIVSVRGYREQEPARAKHPPYLSNDCPLEVEGHVLQDMVRERGAERAVSERQGDCKVRPDDGESAIRGGLRPFP